MRPDRRACLAFALIALTTGCALNHANAQGRLGIRAPGAPTLGGRMMWSDEVIFQNYRIQKNSLIGHYHLLDPNDRRITYGSFETCLEALEKARADAKLPPMPKDVVIVLHGLGAYRHFMNGFCTHLEDNGLHVINFGYPSTLENIDAYAKSLDSVVRHLEGVETVSFVGHSMGNIVVRRYLHDMSRLSASMRPNVKFKRMVMIAAPNHGATLADDLAGRKILMSAAKMMMGEPFDQLAPSRGWPELEKQLATPDFEFGVIAGGQGDDEGYLADIPGDDDGLLSVETMKLAGASDFIQTNGLHQFMPNYKEVREACVNYLTKGYFVSPEARQPLIAAAEPIAAPAAATP